MKKIYSLFVFILLASSAWGQIHLTPFVGINSTRLKLGYDYQKGGNYIFGGVELEARLKPKKISAVHVSFVTGVTYLSNGFYSTNQFSFPSISFYSYKLTNLSTQYVQVPLMIKLNWQPFPLVEDFQFYVGAGVSLNTLLKATLAEKTTGITYSLDAFAPPDTKQYQDSQDITSLGVKQSIFTRIDVGLRFKRVQVAFRLSISSGDMYYQGLEKIWNIPAANSGYIAGHETSGETTEKYSEFVIGYRIF